MLKNATVELMKPIWKVQSQFKFFSTSNVTYYAHNTSLNRQAKVMSKLFGNRVSGSKKRWYPQDTDMLDTKKRENMFEASHLVKTAPGAGKNASRRVAVLNKLFMKHITDLMATGEISEKILGCGLQITRVKVSSDFTFMSVYWSSDQTSTNILEMELQRCSGLLRHELSQMSLMGAVPRIKFVREKMLGNIDVEAILNRIDFDAIETEKTECHKNTPLNFAHIEKESFFGKALTPEDITKELNDEGSIEMRQDAFGLDHSKILLKILTKMRKSKQAWETHNNNINLNRIAEKKVERHSKLEENNKDPIVSDDSQEFRKFLTKRRERKNIKFDEREHVYNIDFNNPENNTSCSEYDEGDHISDDADYSKKF